MGPGRTSLETGRALPWQRPWVWPASAGLPESGAAVGLVARAGGLTCQYNEKATRPGEGSFTGGHPFSPTKITAWWGEMRFSAGQGRD